MQPKTLDHVAFWVAGRDRIADFLTGRLDVHVIDRQETFTLVGADARRFKLTLFDAPGPRVAGAFGHVALRVGDLERARARLPVDAAPIFDAGEGLRIELVQADAGPDYDLDHVALLAPDPALAAAELERYGFRHVDGESRAEVGGAYVEFHAGRPAPTARPLLNHLAVLVDSVDDHIADAEELGIEVESIVDAPNTYAAFMTGPEGVRIEYVEHKPSFSLT
jgi:catechol 2,3-dioxygenase-like lactoylglutathione lyase family enzyme